MSGLDPDVKLALALYHAAVQREVWEGNCHCEFPEDGETGTIECFTCAVRRVRAACLSALATRNERPLHRIKKKQKGARKIKVAP